MASKIRFGDELMFPSDYLAAIDCTMAGGDLTLTIVKITREILKLKGKEEKKPKNILHFKETEKKLICNVTNGESIATWYGDLALEWIGKPITLYATKCPVGREVKDCIRVREKTADIDTPPPPAPKALPPELQAIKDEWLARMATDPNLETFNSYIAELPKDGDARKIAWKVMDKHAKEFGIVFDRKTNLFKPKE